MEEEFHNDYKEVMSRLGLDSVQRLGVKVVDQIVRDFIYDVDPPHLQDSLKPCYGCGARWAFHTTGRQMIMDHTQPCAYLEAHSYGAERELGNDV
jgi:hypothetical protein